MTETARIRAFSPGLAARDAAHDDHSADDADEAPPAPDDDHSEGHAEEAPLALGGEMQEPVVLEIAEPKEPGDDVKEPVVLGVVEPKKPAAGRSLSPPTRKRRRTAKAKKKAA